MMASQAFLEPRPDRSVVYAQRFLRQGGTLDGLKKVWAIDHKRGMVHTNLVSLKYNQIDSPMSQPIVQQCRGIVLDEADNWAVVSRPFDKFFSHGEGNAATIDWDTAKVLEKLDGSLIHMYWYGEWMVGTSGTPDGFVDVYGHPYSYTYAQLARWIMKENQMVLPDERMWNDWTFLFELTSPFNRVVVKHDTHKLTFLGARSRLSGEELHANELPCEKWNWEKVSEHLLINLEEILYAFRTQDPLKREGYVVVDREFNRLKVKHPGYIALHHLRGNGFTPRRVLDAVRTGEVDEIIAAFPEWKEPFESCQHRYASFIAAVQHDYDVLEPMPFNTREDIKAFALRAVKTVLPAAVFAVKKKQFGSIRQYIREMQLDYLMIQLETYNPSRK